MLIFFFVILLGALGVAQGKSLKLRLNPASVPTPQPELDYATWTISGGTSASKTVDGVNFTLSVPSTTVLRGAYYKLVYTRMAAFLGERVVGEGLSTESTIGDPITLTLKGLSTGNHTLLTYHNGWDSMPAGAVNINITVDGALKISSQHQTVRVDNIWDSESSYINFGVSSTDQEVKIVYTPLATGNLTDLRAFLNAFEIDTPNVKSQGDTGLKASWEAPKLGNAVSYDVYFAVNDNTTLKKVSSAQTERAYTFSDLSTLDTYYWRVDTVEKSGQVITGRIFEFRLRQLAFPGAEGYGRFARGGRGGRIVKVTSLDDYDPAGTPVAGTLRYAVTEEKGPRTIVFDIGGVITLTSRLTVNSNYLTIAGQTAPGKGIAIQGWPMGLSGATDVIVRHMRVRPGKISNQTVDGMGMQGSNHAIFDRNSMGWSMDESFSSRSAYNITFQRNMISEPLNIAGHKNYPPGTAHGYAASISGDIGSFHHNLIAHAYGRSWSMAGGVDANGYFAGRLDIRNNVVYNFGTRVTDGGAHNVNFVSNLYKRGPASKLKYDLQATYEDGLPGTQQYYCLGNSMPGYFDQNSPQVVEDKGEVIGACFARVTIDPPPSYQQFFDVPFFESYVDTQTSTEAYKRVLSDSGAQSPILDDHDKRIIRETLNGTTTYTGSVGGLKGIIDNEADVGGLESFPTTRREESWDADGDGIADWWDGSNGGDDGWTALDGYLNFLADPHVFVEPGATKSIDLVSFSAGFVQPCTYTVSAQKGSVAVSGSKASYNAPSSGVSVDSIVLFLKDAEGSTWSRTVGVGIFTGASSVA